MSRPNGLAEIAAVVPDALDTYSQRPAATCWVYEVWDARHRLAYVGIADDFAKRWAQHRRMSWWLGEIDIWYVDLFGYRSRWEARRVEAVTIHDQNPVYNTAQESSAYAAYMRLSITPEDDLECVPVKRRRYEPMRVRSEADDLVQSG
ncbi:GIY-YIG nuclease family protein [Microbacterium sp. W4I20]|uniref:GIY-YIG nuclease family protein n=1 Tax=Microbacterium sp. W4I20 TaxID=3042262 RepID=UPI00277DC6A2|nr:GIY-YIG nuclease family protein [Microbacterium sp. W4I20]MDQ0726834.1 hypothetical protein [Microbacterium sp. W4I20]